ncbi:MAG: LOG family protein [Candidatus Marinimicrobia bacterium]|jgi:hypothetical protein|nr:LOG family protein [Candidatus Neomarinimicrobiota bacterium]MBT3497074.1 LOG family protein [Candidatus Neomarinimicrobiota bacterium]MBT3691833.1 LOG family protein [Candidatus Neomarinimicrobiota bacterium]MBT3731884.1 LOG family protein [Candidatus Neomarinimicrobiota bacterium]MBT4144666.1 LOG family protein [Candidatus Neomarinimicrobiota bacterium]
MSDKFEKDRFYLNPEFLESSDARSVRILSEYYGPLQRIKRNKIEDTIVFFGSARIQSKEMATKALKDASENLSSQEKNRLKQNLKMSRYYELTRELAYKLTKWSMTLKNSHHRYIITSGGGPGIMEAANRGASEAGGPSLGLTISLPHEQSGNEWISDDLNLTFHYFFMRKYWFLYLAKGLVVWPGGFGTLDEVMELLTLIQTEKIKKRIPIVLFDEEFWMNVVNWDYLVEAGTISQDDLNLFKFCNTVEEAFDYTTSFILEHQLKGPNF